jgi:hypothetical protein
MRTITIKKTDLALFKGLNLSNADIATRLGITTKEVTTAMETFGLIKRRGTTPEYQIQYVDDCAVTATTTMTIQEEPEFIETTEEETTTEFINNYVRNKRLHRKHTI